MKNSLEFRNGRLRILQVSDPQDLKYVRRSMVRMLNKAYDDLKPDLVVFTGDNILGNHLLDARFGTRKVAEGKEATYDSMYLALAHILQPVNRRRIPFAMIYGNHDDMNCVTKDEQADIYRQYPMSMEMNRDDKSVDCDTYTIELRAENGEVKYCLYMLDCAWQDKTGEKLCHTEVKPETVSWLKKETEKYKNIPSMLFIHIPLPEQYNFTEVCDAKSEGAIKGDDGSYIRLDKSVCEGVMNEPPSVLEESNGLFDVIREAGIQAVVTGHDHGNCFIGKYDGVDFIQTGAASFRCYGNKRTRGVRVIDIYEDGRYETEFRTFFDICGKTPLTAVEFFLDADEYEVIKYASLGSVALAAISGLAAAGIIKYIKKKR